MIYLYNYKLIFLIQITGKQEDPHDKHDVKGVVSRDVPSPADPVVRCV